MAIRPLYGLDSCLRRNDEESIFKVQDSSPDPRDCIMLRDLWDSLRVSALIKEESNKWAGTWVCPYLDS